MRKKVEHYQGKEITRKIIRQTEIIDLQRIKEGITQFSMGKVKTVKQLAKIHNSKPEDEHVILGEDWYLSYTIVSESEMEIKDWIAIGNVENKFAQTMEMFNAFKQILLEYSHCNIYSILRHSTSYQFYKKLLDEGLIEEHVDVIDFDDYTPKLEEIKQKIFYKYDSYEDYLSDENRERYEEYQIEDFIYHEVCFNTTKKFTNRYKR